MPLSVSAKSRITSTGSPTLTVTSPFRAQNSRIGTYPRFVADVDDRVILGHLATVALDYLAFLDAVRLSAVLLASTSRRVFLRPWWGGGGGGGGWGGGGVANGPRRRRMSMGSLSPAFSSMKLSVLSFLSAPCGCDVRVTANAAGGTLAVSQL